MEIYNPIVSEHQYFSRIFSLELGEGSWIGICEFKRLGFLLADDWWFVFFYFSKSGKAHISIIWFFSFRSIAAALEAWWFATTCNSSFPHGKVLTQIVEVCCKIVLSLVYRDGCWEDQHILFGLISVVLSFFWSTGAWIIPSPTDGSQFIVSKFSSKIESRMCLLIPFGPFWWPNDRSNFALTRKWFEL